MEDKISYNDLEEYEHLFKLVPSIILKRMAKKNSNLISKFKPSIMTRINNLTDNQRNKLDIILNSDVEDLQTVLGEAYSKTGLKQYKILADSKNRNFIQFNLNELRKLI